MKASKALLKSSFIRKIVINGFVLIFFVASCKTTSPTVKVNRKTRNITVYSSSEKDSSLAKSSDSGSIDETIAILKEKLEKDPKDVDLLIDLGRLYLLKKNLEISRKLCRKALAYDIHNKRGAKLLAEIEMTGKQLVKAEIILNRLGGFDAEDSDVLNLLGLIALKRNKFNDAFDFFIQGLKINPEDAAIRMNLGSLHLRFKQVRQAQIQFAKVLEAVPNHLDAMLHLGITKAYFGRLKEASSLYQRVLSQDSENSLALYNYALVEFRMDNLEGALEKAKAVAQQRNLSVSRQKQAKDLRDKIRAEIQKRKKEQERKKLKENQKKKSKKLASKAQEARL